MKAFALVAPRKLAWVEKPRPVCGAFDAIVRPTVIAPCTSDVHNVYEHDAPRAPEFVFGHECVGEVVEVGSSVRDFAPGDKVIVPAATPDWRSRGIQDHDFKHPAGPFTSLTIACLRDGEFAEFFAVNDADCNLVHCPDDICDEDAVMATDMIPTGLTGAKIANIRFGDTVCVFGIGPVGLMAVAGTHMRGAARILAVGTRPTCVEAAKFYGADEFISYKNGTIEDQVLKMTDGKGVDRVVVAGGGVQTFESAVKSLKPGGKIGNVNYLGSGDYINIPRVEWGVGMGHKQLIGGLMPGGRLRMEKLGALVTSGKLDVSKLTTHLFHGWEHIPEALQLMKDKPADLIKPVVILDNKI
jgi:threonine dehydrogenase-like Zn-dependent dehydrogenase